MTEEKNNAVRLRDEQRKVLHQSDSQIGKWENLQKEYKTLQDKLATLPQKIESKTMIPIGSVGLFPGKLIHTNEITVLLGDNWFVQQSAHQASNIVQRRLSILNERLENAKKENELFKSQMKLTEEITNDEVKNELVDIKEEEPGTVQKSKRRIAHAASHNVTPRQVRKFDEFDQAASKSSLKTDDTTEKLFARLEELELEEKKLRKVFNEDGVKTDDKHEQRFQSGDKIDSMDQEFSLDDVRNMRNSRVHFDVGSMSSSEELDSSLSNCIKFHHTTNTSSKSQDSTNPSNEDIENQLKFKSPADIYAHFLKLTEPDEKPLKSILKKERKSSNEGLKPRPILKYSPEHKVEDQCSDEVIDQPEDEPKPILKAGTEAVSSTVLEKQVNTTEPAVEEATQKKPMSRFKASRMKKQ